MKNKNITSKCNCSCEENISKSRRKFLRNAAHITIIGGTAFVLEACGSSSSSPTGPTDPGDGGGNGGGSGGGGNTGTGYEYNSSTGIITIDISRIYTSLQNTGTAIALSASNTFDNRGLIVIRSGPSTITALSRRCTHQSNTVNVSANNLLCPSHNSIFDFNGNVISGPATSPLTKYTASISNSIITISNS
jgi:Rieske Fe-S protein